MTYEMLVGLGVSNDEVYAEYRAAMKPILERFAGGFRYDFQIAKTLKSEASHEINRVFIIYFADQKSKDIFFSDAEYLEVKKKFFEVSVKNTTILAQYSRS